MNADRYQRSKRLFEAALALSEAERDAYLEAECAEDAELLAEVRALLEAAEGDSTFSRWLDEPTIRVKHPERIGDYRILGVAGRGGMGTVYEAEQDQPRRRVALKVVDAGVVGPSVLRRFEREAEILARLQHPGIAQIYAAGTFDDGAGPQPYFAMEFVRGRTLIDYANAQKLDVDARLRLVVRVAEAVSHAHAHGVIHRDLKPANILVDEAGQPKVLDFGVARVTDEDLPHATLQTTAGELVGTLPYMSPEQAAAEPGRIDERADVYALGVLMHELLTGELPLSMRGRSVQEAVRTLQEDEPTPLGQLDRGLRGDVETIVLKALAKEPERRYLSADDLAEDVRRYLAHEPIVARPPSLAYQLVKFGRRRKGLVIGIGSGLVIAFGALTVALAVSLTSLNELERSEARAQRESARSAIAAAAASLEIGEVSTARRQLERVPTALREWEWNYYSAQLDTSIASYDASTRVAALAFRGDGSQLVIALGDGRLQHWDPTSRAVVRETTLGRPLPAPPGNVNPRAVVVAFDERGERLGVLDEAELIVFDADSGDVLARCARPEGVQELAISHDGSRVAVCGTGGLWSWALDDDTLRQVSTTRFTRLDFADDGSLFALRHGLRGGESAVFDLATGERLVECGEWSRVHDVELVGADGELFVARADDKKSVRRFDAQGEETIFGGHALVPRAIAWNAARQRLASGADDSVVRVWDPDRADGAVIELHGQRAPITDVLFDSGGLHIAALAGTTIRVWRAPGSAHALRLEHPHAVYTVDYAADGSLLSSDWKGLFREWSADGELLREVQDRSAGSRLAFADDRSLYVRQHWEYLALLDADLRVLQRVQLDGKLSSVSMSGDGSHVAARNWQHIYVFRTGAFEPVFHYVVEDHGEPVSTRFADVLLDARGERLYAQDARGDLVAWELPSGREVARFRGQAGVMSRLAFDADGARLASGSEDGSTWVWDLESERVVARLGGHASRIYAIAFTPDGRRLATGSDDTTVRVWDLEDEVETAVFSLHTDYVYDLDFSPNGRRLASASGDHTIYVWDTVPPSQR